MYNSLYPINVKPYYVNRQVVKRKEDDESSSNGKAQAQEAQENAIAQQNQRPSNSSYGEAFARQQYPNGQQSAIDYSKSTVNIAQIITDFKNTTEAIGAPDDIKAEVHTYLGLIEAQSQKTNPNGKIIQTNLKTASQILDNYITETLKKPSDVVEKWIDALFLQKIDFKSDPTAINPDFQVQLPEKKNQSEQKEPVQAELTPKKNDIMHSDVRRAFMLGKKYSSINDTSKALDYYEKALLKAKETENKAAAPIIYMEVAKIYDDHDLLPQALTLYNKAISGSDNSKLKSKAHYSMAKIYDDSMQFQPAMEHYFSAIGYAGQDDNFKRQTKSLINIGNMYADKYHVEDAKSYYELAQQISTETKNNLFSGNTYKKTADKMSELNEPKTALSYYKNSSYYLDKANDRNTLAQNYEKSSALMLQLGNRAKAKSLLKKAHNIYKQDNNAEAMFSIEKQLLKIG